MEQIKDLKQMLLDNLDSDYVYINMLTNGEITEDFEPYHITTLELDCNENINNAVVDTYYYNDADSCYYVSVLGTIKEFETLDNQEITVLLVNKKPQLINADGAVFVQDATKAVLTYCELTLEEYADYTKNKIYYSLSSEEFDNLFVDLLVMYKK